MAQYKVPVVIEIILERVTNISMGTEIDNITASRSAGMLRRTASSSDRAVKPRPISSQ